MITLLSTLFGFAGSFLPDVINLFKNKQNNKHELAMLEYQTKLMQAKSDLTIKELEARHKLDYELKTLGVEQSTTLAAQNDSASYSGGFVGAFKALVRPIITYWFMSLYTFSKYATFVGLIESGKQWHQAGALIFNEYDLALLSTIIGFWFGDRVKKYLTKTA